MISEQLINITQGEFVAISSSTVCVTTVLGSCVAACLWDENAEVGGMNHILMPESTRKPEELNRYGVNSMEILINEIIKKGGSKKSLQAKVFGGASMMQRLGDVGKRNAEFVLRFLEAEGIPCRAKSLGGTRARRIQFWPASGKARQKFLGLQSDLQEPFALKPKTIQGNSVELF